MEIISVSIAEIAVAKNPAVLETQSLGSCVGIALYDPVSHIGGLAHIMLPDSKMMSMGGKPGKYANTAVKEMLDRMLAAGARRTMIVSKIAGGACMFSGVGVSEFMNIGLRNVAATKNILKELGIPLTGEDTGGNFGRTVELHTDTGKLMIKSAMHEIREI
ncbi:MAG: chemotaxis protein CheD [Endomicrobiales bacterium]